MGEDDVMREMTAADLANFQAAVQFRDRLRAAAMAAHERAGLVPSARYANSTIDAIVDIIRADWEQQIGNEGVGS